MDWTASIRVASAALSSSVSSMPISRSLSFARVARFSALAFEINKAEDTPYQQRLGERGLNDVFHEFKFSNPQRTRQHRHQATVLVAKEMLDKRS